MATIIRETKSDDLEGISNLFEVKRSEEEIRWTYFSPSEDNPYNSFVAENSDSGIVGVIAYRKNIYRYRGKEISGIIPLGWKVLPSYKGLAGIQLFLKVINCTDFGFALGGTEMAMRVQTLAKLGFKLNGYMFYKVVDPLYYLKIKDSRFPRRIARTLKHITNKLTNSHATPGLFHNIKLEETTDIQTSKYELNDSALINLHTHNHIQWLLDCPLAESHTLKIMLDNELIGFALCYVKKIKYNITRGRIVHLPFLGHNTALWTDTIVLVEQFLRAKNCALITTMSLHPSYSDCLLKLNYRKLKVEIPLYVRDKKNLLVEIPEDEFYMTFSEADKACRGL